MPGRENVVMMDLAKLLDLNLDKHERVKPSPANVLKVLTRHPDWDGVLRFNQLTDTEEYWPGEADPLALGGDRESHSMSDHLAFLVRVWLEDESEIEWSSIPTQAAIQDAIDSVCRLTTYHPVRDYLVSLARQWDGEERINHWLEDFCEAEGNEYVRAVARRSLIGAVARAMEPGCKLDTMLVLVGPQGVRKSTLIRTMGQGWSIDTPIALGSKDAFESIRNAWIVEMPELAGLGGKDVERLKAFFSSPVDTYRPAYGRKVVSRPRCCVFWGTTNDRDFLRDATGSRRFWCVEVGEIDIEALTPVVDQLWGEALMCFLDGERHWLSEEESLLATQCAESFTAIDPWEDEISVRLAGLDKVHTSTLFEWLEVPSKEQHAGHAQRLVRIMCGRLGWQRTKNPIRIAGRQGRGFARDRTVTDDPEQDTF